jgi:predicted  nucleic acid-binding Zn-ribbon protein
MTAVDREPTFDPRQLITWATLRACCCCAGSKRTGARVDVGLVPVLNEIRHLQDRGIMSPKAESPSLRSRAFRFWRKLRGYCQRSWGVTMQGEWDKDGSKVGAARTGTEFTKFREEKRASFDIQSREFEKYTWELRTKMEQRLGEAEERLTRDIRISLSLGAVMSAVGAMLIASFFVTRDVNNSVIALQKDIIAAQTALKTASDALIEQRQKLANAEADFTLATGKSTEARSKLEAITPLLDKARGEYEGLAKATTDARSKLGATTPLLDKARGEYEGLAKAIVDARSKLEATPLLLDKARGEYEKLAKAATDARSKLDATTPLLDKARGEYEKLAKASTEARSKLDATTPPLDKARGEYENLAKASTDALFKLQEITSMQDRLNKTVEATTPLLDKARGEYEKLAKASTEARSKLDATTPLLDKARGEYEELTKRLRVLYQPPNQ